MVTTPLRRFGTLYDEIEKLNSTVSSNTYKVRKKFSGIYALKQFKKEFSDKKLKRQIDIYAHLGKEENPYFLKYISSSEDEMIVRDKYIVLELVEKGELENFLLLGNYFSEKIAKIMIFKIILPKQKQILKEDIINIGYLIIQLLTGKFNKKIIKQKMHLAIKKGNYELFWKVLEGQGEYNFSLELKDLINTILSEKISDIETLLIHNWFDAVRKIRQNEFILYEQLIGR